MIIKAKGGKQMESMIRWAIKQKLQIKKENKKLILIFSFICILWIEVQKNEYLYVNLFAIK